jgi:hypothetical protein
MIYLAFYRGEFGTWQDRLICAVTCGPYSHVEMLLEPPQEGETMCISASGRDGGVRVKQIDLRSGRWVIKVVDGDHDAAARAMLGEVGKPYDLIGALLSPFRLALFARPNDRWFCSEIFAWARGLPLPMKMHPNALAVWAAMNGVSE